MSSKLCIYPLWGLILIRPFCPVNYKTKWHLELIVAMSLYLLLCIVKFSYKDNTESREVCMRNFETTKSMTFANYHHVFMLIKNKSSNLFNFKFISYDPECITEFSLNKKVDLD